MCHQFGLPVENLTSPNSRLAHTVGVGSNSTRAESSVAIRPHPEGQVQVDAPKASDPNGYQRITRLSRGMQAGLKMLLCPAGLSCVS